VLGNCWTLLVVREAFVGTRRFACVETNLGNSKNVLSLRLNHRIVRGSPTLVNAAFVALKGDPSRRGIGPVHAATVVAAVVIVVALLSIADLEQTCGKDLARPSQTRGGSCARYGFLTWSRRCSTT
jgi:hypothetical protein